jgi:hypothetical protein
MQSLNFNLNLKLILLLSFVMMMFFAFLFFAIGVTSLVIASGHGDVKKLPTNRQFNRFNVLLYPKVLDQQGAKLHKFGLSCLGWWISTSILIFVFYGIIKLIK